MDSRIPAYRSPRQDEQRLRAGNQSHVCISSPRAIRDSPVVIRHANHVIVFVLSSMRRLEIRHLDMTYASSIQLLYFTRETWTATINTDIKGVLAAMYFSSWRLKNVLSFRFK